MEYRKIVTISSADRDILINAIDLALTSMYEKLRKNKEQLKCFDMCLVDSNLAYRGKDLILEWDGISK